jgi:hypothetical protein
MEETETSIIYYFNSTGPRGVIPLALEFRWYRDDIWEVGYGIMKPNGAVSYSEVTNNGDTRQILALISRRIQCFLEGHPDTNLLLLCSSSGRIRLFRMAAAIYLAGFGNKIIIC